MKSLPLCFIKPKKNKINHSLRLLGKKTRQLWFFLLSDKGHKFGIEWPTKWTQIGVFVNLKVRKVNLKLDFKQTNLACRLINNRNKLILTDWVSSLAQWPLLGLVVLNSKFKPYNVKLNEFFTLKNASKQNWKKLETLTT